MRGCVLKEKPRHPLFQFVANDTFLAHASTHPECYVVTPETTQATETTTTATTTTAAAAYPAGCSRSALPGVFRSSTPLSEDAANTGPVACARACSDEARCVYWTIHNTRGCQLRPDKKGHLPTTASYSRGHGVCAKTTSTTRVPTAAAAATTTTTTVAATTTTTAAAAATTTKPTQPSAAPATTTAATAAAAPLSTCIILKRYAAGIKRRHAYQGKGIGSADKGLPSAACAAKCAALPACQYWISHVSKGCILKYWHLTRKKVTNDAYEMHGICAPAMDPGCEQLGVAGSGDGYRAKRGWKTNKEAPVSRSPGACSQLCRKTAGCMYWIVHNTKGCFMHERTKDANLKAGWKKKGYMVRATGRTIPPPWGSYRFRLALRTDAPWGCIVRVVGQTKSRKIPTRNILPLFFVRRRTASATATRPAGSRVADRGVQLATLE